MKSSPHQCTEVWGGINENCICECRVFSWWDNLLRSLSRLLRDLFSQGEFKDPGSRSINLSFRLKNYLCKTKNEYYQRTARSRNDWTAQAWEEQQSYQCFSNGQWFDSVGNKNLITYILPKYFSYVQEYQKDDYLLTGFSTEKSNPYRPKSNFQCLIL